MSASEETGLPKGESSEEEEEEEVFIRRRPPHGRPRNPCGPIDFVVTDYVEENEPRNILEEIVWYKDTEIAARKDAMPLTRLAAGVKKAPPPRDFLAALKNTYKETNQPALIAEVKKASPSKGVIQPNFDPVRIAKAYEAGGATCLSVLTDEKFFQGSFSYLREIRAAGVTCPLLCKEFVVEPYQVFLARFYGADAILLIAAVLPNSDLAYLLKVVKSLGMTALVEVHTEGELERVLSIPEVELVGINNRDLGTFEVTLETTKRIMESKQGQECKDRDLVVVGESGIFTLDDVNFTQECGCRSILVGESLVKENDPETAIKSLFGR